MSGSTSASRPARASSLLLAALLALAAAPAAAQWAGSPAQGVIVVDLDRALRESAAAAALREIELQERRALRARLDALQASLEAEEAELVRLREELDRPVFDERVQRFDQRVREARRSSQEEAAALQARFAEAEASLRAAIPPIVEALRRENGAAMVIDRRLVLALRADMDATDALIERLNTALPGPASIIGEP